MEIETSLAASETQEEILFMNTIEENQSTSDMVCNTMGCS